MEPMDTMNAHELNRTIGYAAEDVRIGLENIHKEQEHLRREIELLNDKMTNLEDLSLINEKLRIANLHYKEIGKNHWIITILVGVISAVISGIIVNNFGLIISLFK